MLFSKRRSRYVSKMNHNLILIGPMGAGKSTLGKRLSRALKCSFVDSDREIERRANTTISHLFELEGENGFREREMRVIADLCRQRGIVLSTGGGAILREVNRTALRNSGIVVYLQVSLDEQMRRLQRDTQRPLLQTDNPRQRLESLSREREPLYQSTAHWVITTDYRPAGVVVRHILRRLRQYWNAPSC